jgi:tetratricopeptide (TPR) repeat protein
MNKNTILLSLILIALLGFAVYFNSLSGEFIWDDNLLVKQNIYIRSWANLGDIFTRHIGGGATVVEGSSYRPVQIITYMIDYSLWGLNPFGYHFTNILLHIFAALALYWLVTILFGNLFLSLVTAVLFVVHPVHTEAVSYIAGRADSLALGFMMLCFVFYVKSLRVRSKKLYVLTLLSFTLALFSRESALILPVLLLLYHYSFKEKIGGKQFVSMLGVMVIYSLLRATILAVEITHTTTFLQRLPGFFVAMTNYIRLLFLPFDLHMEYGNKLFNMFDFKAILGLIILSVLVIYIFQQKKRNALIFFSLSWFLITLLPSSNLYPLNAYMAEHWLYLPSIGFFLACALGLRSIYKIKSLRIGVIILIMGAAGFFSYLTVNQNKYWHNSVDFFTRTLKYAPDSAKVCNNLGNSYNDIGDKEKAMDFYIKTIAIDPEYAEGYYNLGVVYKDMSRNKEAIAALGKAIEFNPKDARAYNNLGIVYNAVGRKSESIAAYRKAIEIVPNFAQVYNNLGVVYQELGKYEEAAALYKKAITIDPNYVQAQSNLEQLQKTEF